MYSKKSTVRNGKRVLQGELFAKIPFGHPLTPFNLCSANFLHTRAQAHTHTRTSRHICTHACKHVRTRAHTPAAACTHMHARVRARMFVEH